MTSPVTQHLVARAAGVSRSTVTRALRDDPQISKAERERIREVARQLGYRRNPLISALMEQVRSGREAVFHGTLGYIVHGWDREAWRADAEQQGLLAGAATRARELGYLIEVHHHDPAQCSDRRLSDLLAARGILGLLIPPPASGVAPLPRLEWNRFALATLGYRVGEYALHFAANDLFGTVWSALNQLHLRGYRRTGLAVDTTSELLTSFRMEGAHAVFQSRHLESGSPIPPLLSSGRAPDALLGWVREHRPDVVLGSSQWMHAEIRKAGMRMPCDLGFLLLRHHSGVRGIAGVSLRPDLVGAAGVDLVTSQINRSEAGVPVNQKGVLIEGEWVSGTTVRGVSALKPFKEKS